MAIGTVVISLFLVLNALGNIPLFVSLLARYDIKRQRIIIFRELLIALGTLILFAFCGENVMQLLGITQPVIGMAGGILLMVIALSMIFPKEDTTSLPQHEPLIVPLAIPGIAGPGAITSVMVFTQDIKEPFWIVFAIVAAWIPTLLILLGASNIKYLLGERGLVACERLGGMLIALIAVQMFTSGMVRILQSL